MIIESLSRYWWKRDRRRNARSLEELETFPKLRPPEQRRWLQQSLQSQIKYFGGREDALPEWREAARIQDSNELWRIWANLPIVNRSLLQTHLHPRNIGSRFGLTGRMDSTGGSTGEPTPFFHDTEMIRACAALGLHARLRMGWDPGRPTIIVWGSERDIGKEVSVHSRLSQVLFGNFMIDGYNLTRPWQFVEIVDDNGKPAGPGEIGRIICTSTICRGTPFLRYEVGDLGEYDAAFCDESGIRALRQIQGRIASVATLPNGKRIQNLYWNHLMKEFTEVRQFQIVVKKDGGLRFLLKGDGFSADREKHLRKIIEDFLGDLPIQITWVDSIPLTRQGKLIQVVREAA